MVIKNVNLETVCGITSTIPDNPYMEVAFAGKSNVGKSSLINALMNRKALARTSSQPGKTQTINFYNINNAMYLVDLPGYGYANANVQIKAKWGTMIENYLHVSKQLVAVFLLIDIRHQPSEDDVMMYDWILHQGYAPIIIATKADKLNRSQMDAHVQMIRETLQTEENTIILPFSALSKQGRDEIWALMDQMLVEYKRARGLEIETDAKEVVNVQSNKKKPRWKAIGKAPAKKTLERQARKKAKKK